MAEKASSSHISNKSKIARRLIEVLEYFDDNHQQATVMDIARRYDRPQSSTSELLVSMVELGLLRKDPASRTYHPTPRAAMIGTSGQPPFVRDGRIVRLIDVLSEQTGYSVALTSMVGLDSQIVQWRHGPTGLACTRELSGGVKDPIHHSAAGWMMLSTFEPRRVEAMLRRLNAEAPDTGKFQIAEMMNRISECGERRYVVGPVGFNTDTRGFPYSSPVSPTVDRWQ